ncbi:MAG TPA: hypothetical protein VKU36_00985 [Candidatus Babeliales bacterium]|nr:hypothetical protein [Candidatus Babeliales bacterium]
MKRIIFLLFILLNGIFDLRGMELLPNPYMHMNIREKNNIWVDISKELPIPKKDLCVSSIIIKKEFLEISEKQYREGRAEKAKENKNNDKYQCTRLDCGYTTNHISRMTSHEKMHNIKTAALKKVYTCETCGFLSLEKRTFENHEQTHGYEMQYECLVEKCGLRTATRKTMEWHLREKHKQHPESDIPGENRYKQLK